MKYTKEDKKFLVTFSLTKKTELVNNANIIATLILVSMAVVFSLYAIVMASSADFMTKATFIIILPLLLAPLWKFGTDKYREYLREVKYFQKQYRKYFNELYPDLEKEGFHVG